MLTYTQQKEIQDGKIKVGMQVFKLLANGKNNI